MIKSIITVKPRGFCAGVTRSIEIVERVLDKYGAPIYVKHAIVHNQTVIQSLENKGAIFVEDVESIPPGSIVVFSAHGSPPEHYRQARTRNLTVIDATCPLVTKVHQEMRHFLQADYLVIYIGHKKHVEAKGVLGEAVDLNKKNHVFVIENLKEAQHLKIDEKIRAKKSLAVLSQTTFNVYRINEIIDELEKRFGSIVRPDVKDICYATTNRQEAISALAGKTDLVLIVGSQESSNSNRLKEIVQEKGIPAYIIDNVKEIKEEWLENKSKIGLSAAASAPEFRVQEIVSYFVNQEAQHSEIQGNVEKMHFSLPKI